MLNSLNTLRGPCTLTAASCRASFAALKLAWHFSKDMDLPMQYLVHSILKCSVPITCWKCWNVLGQHVISCQEGDASVSASIFASRESRRWVVSATILRTKCSSAFHTREGLGLSSPLKTDLWSKASKIWPMCVWRVQLGCRIDSWACRDPCLQLPVQTAPANSKLQS